MLRADEAVDLVSAWVTRTAADVGIRVLVIKGSSLAFHGLRPAQTSEDVDLLVEPAKLPDLDAALRQTGWVRREERFRGQWDAPHSRTFVHPEWPCDLDVHSFFPGFLADATVVFDQLWSRRTRMPVAHTSCSIPDAPTSALILLLNRARSGGSSVVPAEVGQWAHGLNSGARDDVREVVARTGCETTLSVVLTALDITPHSEIIERAEVSGRRDRAATGRHGYVFWSVSQAGSSPLVKLRAVLILICSDVTRTGHWLRISHVRRLARGLRRALRSKDPKLGSGASDTDVSRR